jgi:tripartite-type tricarboxylate transporter receptor subunit TctC
MVHIKGGKLKALATTGSTRASGIARPAHGERGGPARIRLDSWNAVYAPAGTPKEIIEKLNRESNAILQSPETRRFFAEQGAESGGGSPEQLADAQPRRARQVGEGREGFRREGRLTIRESRRGAPPAAR